MSRSRARLRERNQPDMSWTVHANCIGVDPELFYPQRGAPIDEAVEVCRSCIVRFECLEHALTHPEKFGIWGGTSERERRRIRNQRRAFRVAS